MYPGVKQHIKSHLNPSEWMYGNAEGHSNSNVASFTWHHGGLGFSETTNAEISRPNRTRIFQTLSVQHMNPNTVMLLNVVLILTNSIISCIRASWHSSSCGGDWFVSATVWGFMTNTGMLTCSLKRWTRFVLYRLCLELLAYCWLQMRNSVHYADSLVPFTSFCIHLTFMFYV